MLKADAYGLGAARVAPALAAAGVASFFVALAEEGVALRGILGPGPRIFILSGLLPGDAAPAAAHALIPCLNSVAQVERLVAAAAALPFVLQLDSGMNRLGLEPGDLPAARARLGARQPLLLMSHLACADEPGHPSNAAQASAFAAAVALFPGVPTSLSATGGILMGEGFHQALTRPGIGLFGGLPFAAARPVVRLSLPVIQVRDVAAGEAVGYGAAWVAPAPARIATLSAGYADGLPRALGNGTVTLASGGRRVPLVGRVSMDLLTADVTGLGEVPDSLDLLDGTQGVDDLAGAAGTIGYEILTSLGPRYERVYNVGPERDTE